MVAAGVSGGLVSFEAIAGPVGVFGSFDLGALGRWRKNLATSSADNVSVLLILFVSCSANSIFMKAAQLFLLSVFAFKTNLVCSEFFKSVPMFALSNGISYGLFMSSFIILKASFFSDSVLFFHSLKYSRNSGGSSPWNMSAYLSKLKFTPTISKNPCSISMNLAMPSPIPKPTKISTTLFGPCVVSAIVAATSAAFFSSAVVSTFANYPFSDNLKVFPGVNFSFWIKPLRFDNR